MTHVNNLMKRLVSTLKRIGKSFQKNRQRSANWEVARMLQQTEYRNESVSVVFTALNNHNLGSLRGYPLK
jgi:uncharacterized protein YukE